MVSLSITSGLHAGATLDLAPGEYTIGRDEAACDIVLSDADILPQHAKLVVLAEGAPVLHGLADASIEVRSRKHTGGPLTLERDDPVVLGRSTLRFSWAAPKPKAQPEPGAPPHTAAGSPPLRTGVRGFLRDAGWASGSMAAVGIAFALVLNSLSSSATTESGKVAEVERVLASLRHADLEVRRQPSGAILVAGYVPTQGERDRIEAALRRVRADIRVQVVPVGAARNMDPGLRPAAGGVASADKKSVLLDGGNAPAPKVASEPAKDQTEVALRVRAVRTDAAGEPILETEEGTRYGIGSLLPGGYMVVNLDADHIVLSKGRDRFLYSLGSGEAAAQGGAGAPSEAVAAPRPASYRDL